MRLAQQTDVKEGIESGWRITACGIQAKDLEKIFDPYFTTRAKGTGLGLSIVHRIVENLNGEIRVESSPSKGTVFFITLPDSETARAASFNETDETTEPSRIQGR